MPDPKKNRLKYGWLERLGSYPIFSIPLKNWLIICTIFGGIFGLISFILYQEVSHPATSETFMAEVSTIWIEQHEDDTGGFRVYKVRLKRAEEEVTCSVPSIKRGLWQGLEIGIKYSISVSQTVRGCYINEVVKLEEQDAFGFDN